MSLNSILATSLQQSDRCTHRWALWLLLVISLLNVSCEQKQQNIDSRTDTASISTESALPSSDTTGDANHRPSAEAVVDPNTFTAAQMGDKWPFATITRLTVACEDNMYAVFQADDGATYALNGAAKTAARSGDKSYKMIDDIWKEDTAMPGAKISIAPMLDRAVGLCK